MRPLIIGTAEKVEIKRVMDYADKNRYDIHAIFRIMKGQQRPPGDHKEHVCLLPIGFRCVFSIDQQPCGWMRHLSVSVSMPGRWPNEHAVTMIAKEFGFRHDLKSGKWHVETEDHVPAVNILERLED